MIVRAIVLGVAVATAAAVGCNGSSSNGGDQQGPSEGSTGTVGLQLTLPGGLQINSVSYSISGPHTYSGTVNVQNATTISFVVPNIAPGSGYTITLTATTTDGSVTCLGTSASFTVNARQTTSVTVNMACTTTAEAGSVLVNGVPLNCATWNSAVANPSSTTVGGTVQLTASASAPDPSSITYAWSAPTGSIDTPAQASANFTCPATPGQVTLTLVVGDGPLPAGATCPASATTATVVVTCNGNGGNDAGPPADSGPADTGAPDTGTDTGPADAGPAGPCTSAGQTNCIRCSGNSNGVCSPTEALFVQHDIAAGHAATTDCYSCLLNAGCLDDTQFGDTNHECGDLTGKFDAGAQAGQPDSTLCMNAVSCVLQTSCSSSDISICYCGPTNAGNACQTAANPNGACYTQEINGLGVSDNATVLKDYTDTTRPAGMANQIFSCAESNSCSACLH
jgi:hypothetical protein